MKIYGDLEKAALESLSSDPGSTVQGRFWQNTTEDRIKHDNGSNKRALLRNDDKAVLGNGGTASDNVRFHRGPAQTLEIVPGNDTTADGTTATSLAKTASRTESYVNSGKPAAGNQGRLVYLTDLDEVKVDNGASYSNLTKLNSISPTLAKGDLMVFDGTNVIRVAAGSDGQYLKANSATASGVEWVSVADPSAGFLTKTANYTILSSDLGKTILIDSSGGSFNLTFPAISTNFLIHIKDIGGTLTSNPVTMVRSGSEKIEMLSSDYILQADYGVYHFNSNGTDRFLV